MHLRPDHAVRHLPTLHAFIRAHPLGVVTTSLPSEDFPTLQCSHIPWVLDADTDQTESTSTTSEANGVGSNSSLGALRGHIARANPQSRAMIEAATNVSPQAQESDINTASSVGREYGHVLPGEILVVFTSPVDHYITPHFYTASKPATGKVAPTWNYAAVQVYGRATIYHDSKSDTTGEFLHQQLSDLARLGEEGIMKYRDSRSDEDESPSRSPWTITDAPPEYIATLKKNIVGLRIQITRIEGRFKVSQERPGDDRSGVVEGLERMQTARAREMAEFVRSGRVVSAPE
ncbi:FMN-binding split barrel-related protein [Penicillium hispanicum]|uniref:FMN-binding split barrel-related protein n=1 Tax=Penicillium hispanicum TaxID=1080232 RepID=UPI002542275A|nr:FMN-binding split barrel-related protein [Penicillium hispanicum]KAJ5570439.1 FMN-binding split barrel-related protein [Penicillium hispanicum]